MVYHPRHGDEALLYIVKDWLSLTGHNKDILLVDDKYHLQNLKIGFSLFQLVSVTQQDHPVLF